MINVRLQDDGKLPLGTNNRFKLTVLKRPKSPPITARIANLSDKGEARIKFSEHITMLFDS